MLAGVAGPKAKHDQCRGLRNGGADDVYDGQCAYTECFVSRQATVKALCVVSQVQSDGGGGGDGWIFVVWGGGWRRRLGNSVLAVAGLT